MSCCDEMFSDGYREAKRQYAAEIERLTAENERLRSILRQCMPGTHLVDIGPGEAVCLYQQAAP